MNCRPSLKSSKRDTVSMHAFLILAEFGLMTNILITVMLLTARSAVVSSLAGIPAPAACSLLPLGG